MYRTFSLTISNKDTMGFVILANKLFSLSFTPITGWDDIFPRCLFEPFSPGAYINTNPRMPQQVSSQSDLTWSDARAAAGPQWFLQVHPCLLELLGKALHSQYLSRSIQERSEWHVDGIREMARLYICVSQIGEWDIGDIMIEFKSPQSLKSPLC